MMAFEGRRGRDRCDQDDDTSDLPTSGDFWSSADLVGINKDSHLILETFLDDYDAV